MFYNPFTPRGFAKGVATAQLKSLQAAQRRNPSMNKEELYCAALSTRFESMSSAPATLVRDAKETVLDHSPAAEALGLAFNFQRVVLLLVYREFIERMKARPTPEIMRELTAGVYSVIPDSM